MYKIISYLKLDHLLGSHYSRFEQPEKMQNHMKRTIKGLSMKDVCSQEEGVQF